jgi:hypothetical protein
VETFDIVDRRDLSPLVEKLRDHGATAVFTLVRERRQAHIQMPEDPQAADMCRSIIEDWNASS